LFFRTIDSFLQPLKYTEYKEVFKIAWILGIPDKEEKIKKYVLYKNNTGIHIHSDWISLVASLKSILEKDEIEKIYTFYGNVSDMKLLIEKGNLEAGDMGHVNRIINNLGIKTDNTYLPNNEYSNILNHLKQTAKISDSFP